MFQNLNIVNRQQQEGARAVANQIPVKLRMPAGFQGKTVPMSIVVMELLWQQYGLDLVHPEVSRWLEQNAPEVKSLVSGDHGNLKLAVGPRGTIEMNLSPVTDDKFRAISSQYILSQARNSMEPQPALRIAA